MTVDGVTTDYSYNILDQLTGNRKSAKYLSPSDLIDKRRKCLNQIGNK